MAHELEFVNGTASTFSVLETPWHGEGVVLAAAPSYDEAMALARLDYEVVKVPTYRKVGDEEFVQNESAFVTKRIDTGAELGMVGPDYQPVQNTEAFRVLKPLVDEGVATLETGGVLRGGADAWLMARWNLDKFGPLVREVFADEVIPFSVVAANHVGRRGVMLKDTPIRIVCANTLGMAEEGKGNFINVRHTGDAQARLVEAAHGMWGAVIERYEALAVHYRALKQVVLNEQEFKAAVLDVIAPDPRFAPTFNPEAKLAELVVARHERKVSALRDAWESGKGHVGDHSGWEAYNGAVEVLDHNTELFPTRGGAYRTASMLDGVLAQRKQAVLGRLLAFTEGGAR